MIKCHCSVITHKPFFAVLQSRLHKEFWLLIYPVKNLHLFSVPDSSYKVQVNFSNTVKSVQMILVMLHDLKLDVTGLLRQKFELSQIRAARPKLVFRVVAVLSCTTTSGTCISQGSVATQLRCGDLWELIWSSHCNFLLNVA